MIVEKNEKLELNNEKIDDVRQEIIHTVCTSLLRSFPIYPLQDLYDTNAMYKFNIINTGDKEISNLRLELPFNGLYTIRNNKSRYSTGFNIWNLTKYRLQEEKAEGSTTYKSDIKEFNKIIEIKGIRPSNQITVIVWTGYPAPLYLYNEKDMRITHPDGVIKIEFPTKVSGFLAWLHKNYFGLFFTLFMVIMGIGIFWLVSIAPSKKSGPDC